jgi:hypothetical protein
MDVVLFAEDRDAVRLSDDKRLFAWFAQNLDDAGKKALFILMSILTSLNAR